MTAMNARFVLVVVLNAVVAVALAALLTVLVMQGPGRPREDAGGERAGDPNAGFEALSERELGPEVAKNYPPQEQSRRIKADLTEHPELIPFEGTLGGTMGFYDPENIYVLSDKWVYARFEDGHIQGGMLLEYSLGPDGEISWQVLEARLE